ncbi:MAG: SRPBCC family protein [Casimicrobium sp.]
MKMFDVQGIEIRAAYERAFSYIADPMHLPKWTNAFATVSNGRAMLRTPQGELEIGLVVQSSPEHGTVDWLMTFPDGSVATAFSRVMRLDAQYCVYTFVLTPPPVPLEQLEGALQAQSKTLAEELHHLKQILENHG